MIHFFKKLEIMNNPKIKESLLIWILYLFLWIASFLWWFLESYKDFFIFGLLLILIKDTLVHGHINFNCQSTKIKVQKICRNLWKQLSYNEAFFIINKIYLFPFILISYLLIILIKQVTILPKIIQFSNSFENIILLILIPLWILSAIRESENIEYIEKNFSLFSSAIYMVLSIALSLIWTFITLSQTQNLWTISYLVSLLIGYLIFLINISLVNSE